MKISNCKAIDLFFALLSIASNGKKAIAMSEHKVIGIYPTESTDVSSGCFAFLDPIDTKADDFDLSSSYSAFLKLFPNIQLLGEVQPGIVYSTKLSFCQDCTHVSEHLSSCECCDSFSLWIHELQFPIYMFANGRTFIPLISGSIEFVDGTIIEVADSRIPHLIDSMLPIDISIALYLTSKADYLLVTDSQFEVLSKIFDRHQISQLINAETSHPEFQVVEWSNAGL